MIIIIVPYATAGIITYNCPVILKAGLSPYYFLRLFASETGFTPHQYLINTRINAAKFLLRSPDIPVKDISVRTGFTSESTFCTCFKKNEGMTPGQYRSSVLNRQESSPL